LKRQNPSDISIFGQIISPIFLSLKSFSTCLTSNPSSLQVFYG
jgi:hypothetical protein